MKVGFLCVVLLVCGSARADLLWDLWFTNSNYANPTWTPPNPPSQFTRLVAGSAEEEAYFGYDRSLQYMWYSPTVSLFCGPKSYLTKVGSEYVC